MSEISRRSFLKGASVVALGGAGAALVGCAPTNDAKSSTTETYAGKAMGRAGEIALEVTIAKDVITKIEVVDNPETATISDFAIRRITSDILAYQSVAVDTVSGATLTSFAVINAARAALTEGLQDISDFEKPVKYPNAELQDETTDVVIIGGGSAGMNAAAELSANGKDVILIEKQGFLGGGDSMFASSGLAGGGGYTVYRLDVKNATPEDYFNEKLAVAKKSGLPVDLDNLEAYSLKTGDCVDHYLSIGVPFGRYSSFSNTIIDGSSPGTHIIKRCAEQIDYLGIDYRTDTSLTSISMDNGTAVGVEVSTSKGDYKISADAVVLASGGFGRNADMLAEYANAASYAELPSSGSISAKGEGILAAMDVGAEIANMDAIKANNICHIAENGAVISLATIQSVAVLVDANGKRFINETGTTIMEKSSAELELPEHRAWAIFDQKQMDQKKLLQGYNEHGYFSSGNTWEELASAMGLSSESSSNFVVTMEKWQNAGKGNVEGDFGATVKDPFDTPPFYAASIQPAMQSTYGGIKTDKAGHVISTTGEIIPGLYAAGAVSGHGCFGNEVGNGLAISSAFGMIVAQTIISG